MSIYHNSKRYRKSLHLKDTPSNRKKAQRILDDAVAKIQLGEIVLEDKTPTFEHYAKIYLENKKREVKEVSYYKYSLTIDKALKYFKNKDINKIKVSDIKKWIGTFDCGGKTLRTYLSVLRGVFEEAFYDEAISSNPVSFVRKPKVVKPEIKPFSKAEVNTLLYNSEGFFRNYIAIGVYTGMRSGEILALTWEDVDLANMEISVTKTMGRFGVQTVKTDGSNRQIPIFDVLVPYLKNQFQLTGLKGREVFLTQYGDAYKNTCILNRHYWKPLLEKSKVPYRRLYNTRHTFATRMLQSGDYPILNISRILGHTSAQMVLSKYTKYIESETIKIKPKNDIYSQRIDIPNNEVPKIGG